VAVGILTMNKKGYQNICYFISDGFKNNGDFAWFFSHENMRNYDANPPRGVLTSKLGNSPRFFIQFVKDIKNKEVRI
jgi:hypothetical protein